MRPLSCGATIVTGRCPETGSTEGHPQAVVALLSFDDAGDASILAGLAVSQKPGRSGGTDGDEATLGLASEWVLGERGRPRLGASNRFVPDIW